MFRLALFPLFIFFSTLILSVVIYFLIKKLRKIIGNTVDKGKSLAAEQQKKWAQKEQQKQLPEILQKGLRYYEQIESEMEKLPHSWAIILMPITVQAKDILDEVITEAANELGSHTNHSNTKSKKLNVVRPFFNHSLDALLQFVKKLNSDHENMDRHQVEKARQNINVFKADFANHQAVLKKSRRMDFDVLMDVIKARLKK